MIGFDDFRTMNECEFVIEGNKLLLKSTPESDFICSPA